MTSAPIDRKDRLGSAALVVLIHVALGYALISSFGVRIVPAASEALKLFAVDEDPAPPPIPPLPEPAKTETSKPKDPQGAAAPPALKNTPTEIVAPKAKFLPPPPIAAVPVAGTGSAAAAGAAQTPGPGTGRGGIGNGLGSGLSGDGSGGGGNGGRAARARQIAGSIGDQDYPTAALVTRAQGIVRFRFTIMPDGGIANCRIARSSGSRALDDTTCRLALRRFRFRPATDTAGRPIATEVEDAEQAWELGAERELPADDEDR